MTKEGELDQIVDGDNGIKAVGLRTVTTDVDAESLQKVSTPARVYLVLPLILLTVTLLGGMRLGAPDNAFIFLKPALICLVFSVVTLFLFFRSGLISIDGWLSDGFTTLRNGANGCILICLFAATVQLFNSLLPEQGLPFWVVGFCFIWTLWNNLFAGFDTQRLFRSLSALFGMAFIVKYLILINLTAPEGAGWLQRIIENPGREALTWTLDLPRYGRGTGYIQFFTLVFYFVGLYLTPSTTKK